MQRADFVFGTGYLGISFMFLFTGFNATQSLLTSLYADMGNVCFVIIYISFGVSCVFIARPAVDMLGARITSAAGAATYTLFSAANIWPMPYFLYPASALCGAGASVVWTAQGVYISQCSMAETSGRHSAVFFFFQRMSLLFGNLISSYVLHRYPTNLLFFIFTLCGGISTLMMCFLPSPPQVSSPVSAVNFRVDTSPRTLLANMWEVWRETATLRRGVPMWMWHGVAGVLFSVWFTARWITPNLGLENIGYVMLVFGVCNIAAIVLLGSLSDKVGRVPCLFFAAGCLTCGLACCTLRYYAWGGTVSFLEVCAVAGLFGVSDGGVVVGINSYLSAHLAQHASTACAVCRAAQCVASSSVLFLTAKAPLAVVVVVHGILIWVAAVMYCKGERSACSSAAHEESTESRPVRLDGDDDEMI